MKIPSPHCNCLPSLALVLGSILLAPHARSAVVVYFEQAGSDVKISWSGTLEILAVSEPYAAGQKVALTGGSFNFSAFEDLSKDTDAGQSSYTSLSFSSSNTRPAPTVGAWGFSYTEIYWSDAVVSAGTMTVPTQLSFDPNEQIMMVPFTTLAGLGAANFSNTLAWTATTTGDTIRYSTGAAPIPEPASALLLGLAGTSLLVRRRRA